jgi:2-iminobutanoate/2-iminopropanoate deaminase
MTLNRSILIAAASLLAGVVHAQGRPSATYINVPGWAPPPGYSHAVAVNSGRLVFLAGAVAEDAKGEIVGKGDFRAQVTRAFENLRAELAAAGATPSDLVKLNYYVVGYDHDKLLTLRELRSHFVDPAHAPVSTLVGV